MYYILLVSILKGGSGMKIPLGKSRLVFMFNSNTNDTNASVILDNTREPQFSHLQN